MKLRPHQIKFSKVIADKLNQHSICYLSGEVRSGKTLTALESAKLYDATSVLVVTKKKAISSIENDYKNFGFTYKLTCINYESLHKVKGRFDLIIYDEAHSLSKLGKPSKRTKLARQMFYKIPCILMTGSSAVESYSQYFHQFWVSKFSPFNEYKNFYKWVKDFVNVKELRLPTHTVKDYSDADIEKVDKYINPVLVVMSQKDAGFETNIEEITLKVETPKLIRSLTDKLLKDKVIEGQTGFIFGDSPAKLQSKAHQLFNGSCIIEVGDGSTFTKIFSTFKADFIKDYFKGQKIAMLYYYQAELDILRQVFGADNLTTDLEEFNASDKNFALQCTSTEGMNLSKAEALVVYNLGFSGTKWIQARDRMTVKGRKDNKVYIVCESKGITKKIYDSVSQKKNFNSRIFKKEFLTH